MSCAPTLPSPGTACFSKASHFALISFRREYTPVTLPSGCASEIAAPDDTGSSVVRNDRHGVRGALSDFRVDEAADDEIDLVTAVDVAIRDLREILCYWGSEGARQRAQECELMLRRAFSGSVAS